ncbi:serine-rich single-pass membrane protein 1 isoform X1 [Talpa occidentalis]|uniref:serine-rich single-pass membrane protein 1 isoform X1 n=2 Tax=Talpa occidentalis TaxID=50954 RepID=UPI00189027BB|nr:serine-rich single-pass membrane protein 1 isoform X1 [Talpa occidentalis]
MGDLFSLFWHVDPPPIPLSFSMPSQDYECRKDDSCGTIGSFLLWYFVIILILMALSRASVWMSEKKKDEDSGASTSVSKASKDSSHKRSNKDGAWDSSQMMKKSKLSQLTPVTNSEVALVNAYLEQRRVSRHFQFSQVNQTHDSDTTECDSDESNSGASSWKESESEHHLPPVHVKKRKIVQRQKNLGTHQTRDRPCLHCKAMRTNEWLIRHFLQNTSVTTPIRGDIPEENCLPDIDKKYQ